MITKFLRVDRKLEGLELLTYRLRKFRPAERQVDPPKGSVLGESSR